MKKMIMGVLALTAFSLPASAQQATTAAVAEAPSTQTALDEFLAETGVLTLRESLGQRRIAGNYGSEVTLEAVRLSRPTSGSDALVGIRVGVNDGERYSSTRYKFLELDEIDDAISAINYMVSQSSKLNTSFAPQLDFSSKSSLQVSYFHTGKEYSGAITASNERAFISSANLVQFNQALADLRKLLN